MHQVEKAPRPRAGRLKGGIDRHESDPKLPVVSERQRDVAMLDSVFMALNDFAAQMADARRKVIIGSPGSVQSANPNVVGFIGPASDTPAERLTARLRDVPILCPIAESAVIRFLCLRSENEGIESAAQATTAILEWLNKKAESDTGFKNCLELPAADLAFQNLRRNLHIFATHVQRKIERRNGKMPKVLAPHDNS